MQISRDETKGTQASLDKARKGQLESCKEDGTRNGNGMNRKKK